MPQWVKVTYRLNGLAKSQGFRRLRKMPKFKARESRVARSTAVRRSDNEIKRNAGIGFFTKSSYAIWVGKEH
jgi:hypothetical protein